MQGIGGSFLRLSIHYAEPHTVFVVPTPIGTPDGVPPSPRCQSMMSPHESCGEHGSYEPSGAIHSLPQYHKGEEYFEGVDSTLRLEL